MDTLFALLDKLTWLHSSMPWLGGATVTLIVGRYTSILDWLLTPAGQATEKDAITILNSAIDILTQSGHPLANNTVASINAISASIQAKTAPPAAPAAKVGAFLIFGLLTLGALAVPRHAQAFSFGQISISPSAGALKLSLEPLVSLTSFKANAGAIFTAEADAVGGAELLANFGSYHFGIAAGFDRDITDNVNYGCAGIATGVQGYGDVAILWRNSGALAGYAIPFGVGVTP